METITYTTQGTCSRFIDVDIEEDVIREVRFIGGCAGNTRGVAALLAGMPVAEAASRLRGIECRSGTSCPDQLARALEERLQKKAV